MNRRALLRRSLDLAGMAALAEFARGAGGFEEKAQKPLKTFGSPCGLRIGGQSDIGPLKVPAYAQLIGDNFNLLTPGNQLKWGYLRPTPDAFAFTDADWMIQFAIDNGMAVHGHNLCWNSTGKSWLDSVLTAGNARDYLTQHIHTVVSRYRGKIDSWDVVNEPVAPWSRRSDGLYPGIWLNLLGPEYIDIAFSATAAADPGTLRVLNIHHVEHDTADDARNRQSAMALIHSLLQRRVPIQAVGIESHLTAGVPLAGANLTKLIRDIRNSGLEVLITELDVDDTQIAGDDRTRDAVVAKWYSDYITLVIPESSAHSLIFFTPCDRWNWLDGAHETHFKRADGQRHRPGLFDGNLTPKMAFQSAESAITAVCRH